MSLESWSWWFIVAGIVSFLRQRRPGGCGLCAGDGGHGGPPIRTELTPHKPHEGGREERGFETIPDIMSKAVFPEKPTVRPLEGSDYELAESFFFQAKVERVWDVVVHVKPGFKTDGASIPRLLWRVFGSPYDPDIFPSAIGHDALYRGEIVPRKDADRAFLKMMEKSGVPEKKRRLVYRGVRWFGWITWLGHTDESVAEARRYIEMDFAPQAIRKDQTR